MEDEARAGLAGIVLAAGAASRFGSAKQLATIGDVTLVARTVRLALGCCPAGVVVVTGAYATAVAGALAGETAAIVHNADWAAGMAGSLHRGIDALPAASHACLILPCDLPAVDEHDLRALVTAWEAAPARPAAAQYAGVRGVPAIFPAASWPLLRRLHGDRGARSVLAALPEVTLVPMPNAARDVDTPDDLGAFTRP